MVDIVIVHYLDLGSVLTCLEALKQQTLLPKRVFIVDNSGDLPELEEQTLGLEILRPQQNLGFAAACNLAARHCQSEWLAFLNPDAFPLQDWLEKLFACIKAQPERVYLSSRQIFHENPQLLDGSGDSYHISGFYRRRGYRQSADTVYQEEVFAASGAAMLIKRKLFLDLDGFDERFFAYGEDVDLGFRLRLLGYSCLYCQAATVRHIGYSTSGGRHSDFSLYYGHRNLVWVFFKNMPLPFLLLFLPLHIALNIVTIIKFALQGQLKTIWQAKRDALKGLGPILKTRKSLQASRKASLAQLWNIFSKSLK